MNQVFKKTQTDIKENIGQVTQLQRDADAARREQEERHHRIAALKKQLELERRQFKKAVQKLQEEMKEKEREELIQRVSMVKESVKQDGDDDKKNKTRSLKADEEENFNSPAVMRRILKL